MIPIHHTKYLCFAAGSSGDEVSADIFFFVLPTTHETIPVLGAICHHTNLHCTAVLRGQQPEHLLRTFQQMWFAPFGLPPILRTDGVEHSGVASVIGSDWCTSHGPWHCAQYLSW
eukprot:868889-Amphidinium_carterae.1